MNTKRPVFRKGALRWVAIVALLAVVFAVIIAYRMYLNYGGDEARAGEISGRVYRQNDGIFTCRYSGGWHVDPALTPTEASGVTFTDGVGGLIVLKYYPSDNHFGAPPFPNRRFVSAESYYHWDKQAISLDSFAVYSPLVPVTSEKWRATEYSLSYRRSFPESEAVAIPDGEGHVRIGTPAKTIHVLEDVVVIPLAHGLFVARLSANPDLYSDDRADFRAILGSLEINDSGLPARHGLPQAPSFPAIPRFN